MSEVLNNWLLEQDRIRRREKEPITSVSVSSIPKGTERGPGKEQVNDDVVFADSENNVYAVCDGVGTNEAGKAVENALKQDLLALQKREEPQNKEEWGKYLCQALLHAGDTLRASGSSEGTTVVLAKLIKEGGRNFAVIVHVGDSRAYKYNPNKKRKLECLTLDDRIRFSSEVGRKKIKKVQDSEDNEPYISEGNKTANLMLVNDFDKSTNEKDISVSFVELEDGAELILTSDGINDNLTTKEMEEVLGCNDAEDPAERLIRKAKVMSQYRLPYNGKRRDFVARAKSDDMSVIVIKLIK